MTEETTIHIWHKCGHCGARPLVGTRYHCTTCPAGPDTDLCSVCYARYQDKEPVHPSAQMLHASPGSHSFVPFAGEPRAKYDGWLTVPGSRAEAGPDSGNGFVVRPEFRSGRDSFFGGHGFVADYKGNKLVITALHVMDELIKKFSIDATENNTGYSGREIPRRIDEVQLYDVLEEKWMFYTIGVAGPMLVLPNARIGDEEPYSYRDIAAFDIKESGTTASRPLASKAPDVGDTVWLAARMPDNKTPLQAVVVDKSAQSLVFRYADSEAKFQATSGAPILNSQSQIVGINVGAGYLDEKLFGHANHVENIRWHVESALS